MKKFFLLLAAWMMAMASMAQHAVDYASIKLDTKEDYDSTANAADLEASNYLLNTPIDKNDARIAATTYLLRWMSGTPEYNFDLNEGIKKFLNMKKDADLGMVYMAAMANVRLKGERSLDAQQTFMDAARLTIAYAKNPANHVKLSRETKKAIEAEEQGELESLLKAKG